MRETLLHFLYIYKLNHLLFTYTVYLKIVKSRDEIIASLEKQLLNND